MSPQNHPSIFINYRRILSKPEAMLIKQELEKHLGAGSTFLDHENIVPGEYWEAKILTSLEQAKVLLCLIPPNWLETTHPDFGGKRRIDLPHDWVRREIEYCIKEGKPIIPMLLEGGRFPAKHLPDEVAGLTRYQHTSQDIRMENIQYDILKVVDAIKRLGIRPASTNKIVSPPAETTSSLETLYPLPGSYWSQLKAIEKPYVGLRYFEEQEASIYFGREGDILKLINKLTQPGYHLLLMYGPSGVGKSSLLNAGLLPRIRQLFEVDPVERRDYFTGLDQQLQNLLDKSSPTNSSKPRLIILDQVEEMFTNKNPERPEEARVFFDLLSEKLHNANGRHFLLVFRFEHFAKIMKPLEGRGHAHAMQDFELLPMSPQGVEQAIKGAAKIQQFNLSISPAFVDKMVAQVCSDEESNIAPLLQLQLRSMWDEAYSLDSKHPTFDETLQRRFHRYSLPKMIDRRLNELPDRFKAYYDNGLVFDLLNHLVTDRLTAGADKVANLKNRYRHIADFDDFLEAMVNTYLVLKLEHNDSIRLAHDSIAPIARTNFQGSERPGQRAWRILNAKKSDVIRNTATSFSESDAEIILVGKNGMPAMEDVIHQKVLKDQIYYLQLREKNFELAFDAAKRNNEHLEFAEVVTNLDIAQREGLHTEKILDLADELPYPLSFLQSKQKLMEVFDLLLNIANGQKEKWAALKEKVQYLPKENLFLELEDWLRQKEDPLYQKMRERYFPQLVKIPGGTFEMGAKGKEQAFDREGPAHKITVDAFHMADTPVTWWQYGLYCLATGRAIPRDSGFGRTNRPMINVSWYEALAYTNWLSLQQGLRPVYQLEDIPHDPNDLHRANIDWQGKTDWGADGYRLPTEAEWEFAASAKFEKNLIGGTKVKKWRFGNGKDIIDPEEINFDASSLSNDWVVNKKWMQEIRKDKFRAATTAVKTFAASNENPFGVYDLSGNVYEWCYDWFSGNLSDQTDQYYQACKKQGTVRNPRGAKSGSYRVVRGGSWSDVALACRSSYRYSYYPFLQINFVGFRVARR